MLKLFPDPEETIEGTGAALRAGETTCVAVLERCLRQIEKWEPTVKAWVVIDRKGARTQAERLDAELAAGLCRGPLHGIPFGIKDIIDVAGLPTAAGFAPWAGRVAEKDALIVAGLRSAGAVIMGKTVTTQFAWVDPPITRNPWNFERTPGGSSSGSAAAVATAMCLAAIGSQTGGSIVRPAAFCGVMGFKPGYATTFFDGVLPFAPSLDHPGPIARSTHDLFHTSFEILAKTARFRLKQEEIRGGAEIEFLVPPQGSIAQVELQLKDHQRFQRQPPAPRFLRPRGFFDRRADPSMLDAFERALIHIRSRGAEISEIADDEIDFEGIVRNHRIIMAAEAAKGHESRYKEHRDLYLPHICALVEEGKSILPTSYSQSLENLEKSRTNGFPGTIPHKSILVIPATIGAAPDPSTTGNPCFNSPWSYLGWPSIGLPFGLDPEGMPLAIQLIGAYEASNSDSLDTHSNLFEAAAWCEAAFRSAHLAGGF